jgi:hypothetical protein
MKSVMRDEKSQVEIDELVNIMLLTSGVTSFGVQMPTMGLLVALAVCGNPYAVCGGPWIVLGYIYRANYGIPP